MNFAFDGPEIYGGSPTATYSDVRGGWPGEGNIDAYPLFMSEEDFHLSPLSPCIDAGNPDPVYNDKCFPPSMGAQLNDMGAYGGPGACGGSGFTLELDTSYDMGILGLDFTLGASEPSMWANYLILTSPTFQVIPLWTLPLPVIDPAIDIPLSFPFPSLGLIGISSGLYEGSGFRITEWAWLTTK